MCAVAANAKIKRDSFDKISVLACSSCSVNFGDDLRPNKIGKSKVAMDTTTSNAAFRGEKGNSICTRQQYLDYFGSIQGGISNAITTFKEDIPVVNTRIDGVQQNIAEQTSLIDQLSSKFDALEQKCEILEKQESTPASDQLLSKVEELERKCDILEK